MNTKLSDRLRYLLKEQNLTQRKLAEITNLTESAVSHYLKGDRIPRGAILLNIANSLGTTTDYLLGKSDKERKDNAEAEIEEAYKLIARNANKMSLKEKECFMKIIFQ